jgi:hypothetical protein
MIKKVASYSVHMLADRVWPFMMTLISYNSIIDDELDEVLLLQTVFQYETKARILHYGTLTYYFSKNMQIQCHTTLFWNLGYSGSYDTLRHSMSTRMHNARFST